MWSDHQTNKRRTAQIFSNSSLGALAVWRRAGGQKQVMKSIFCISLSWLISAGFLIPAAQAQIAVPPPAPTAQLYAPQQLDQLLGPIALYPDPLLSEILAAAAQPTQIVAADRYLAAGGDPNQAGAQPWVQSVQALVQYPNILQWLDNNIAWTTAVGQSFLYQQQDVMDSIQRLRAQAYSLGNLQSTPQQTVANEGGQIEILPANPQVVYVPQYQPDVVYYQRDYGAPLITFGAGLVIGSWLNHDFDWHDHRVVVWDRDHPRPQDWWSPRRTEVDRDYISRAPDWRPEERRQPYVRNEMDRGWNEPARRWEPQHREEVARQVVMAPRAPEPARGSLIGVGNPRETEHYSVRGAESRGAAGHAAGGMHGGEAGHGGGGPGGHDGGHEGHH